MSGWLTTACTRLGAPRLSGRAFRVWLVFVSTVVSGRRARRAGDACVRHTRQAKLAKASAKGEGAHPAPTKKLVKVKWVVERGVCLFQSIWKERLLFRTSGAAVTQVVEWLKRVRVEVFTE